MLGYSFDSGGDVEKKLKHTMYNREFRAVEELDDDDDDDEDGSEDETDDGSENATEYETDDENEDVDEEDTNKVYRQGKPNYIGKYNEENNYRYRNDQVTKLNKNETIDKGYMNLPEEEEKINVNNKIIRDVNMNNNIENDRGHHAKSHIIRKNRKGVDGAVTDEYLNDDRMCKIINKKDNFNFYNIKYTKKLNYDNFILFNSVITSSDVLCLVIYTGDDTRVNMSTQLSKIKRGVIDKKLNSLTVFLFFILALFSIYMVIIKLNTLWYLNFVRFILLFSYVIPISISVNLNVAKIFYTVLIQHDKEIQTTIIKNSAIIENFGNIDYILTDKTGTLTENVMLLKIIHTGLDVIHTESEKSIELQNALKNKAQGNFTKNMMHYNMNMKHIHNTTPSIEMDQDEYSTSIQMGQMGQMGQMQFDGMSDDRNIKYNKNMENGKYNEKNYLNYEINKHINKNDLQNLRQGVDDQLTTTDDLYGMVGTNTMLEYDNGMLPLSVAPSKNKYNTGNVTSYNGYYHNNNNDGINDNDHINKESFKPNMLNLNNNILNEKGDNMIKKDYVSLENNKKRKVEKMVDEYLLYAGEHIDYYNDNIDDVEFLKRHRVFQTFLSFLICNNVRTLPKKKNKAERAIDNEKESEREKENNKLRNDNELNGNITDMSLSNNKNFAQSESLKKKKKKKKKKILLHVKS
uniref:P-type phospholipid transporter n=1 Tax=Piliocolobus tephrosceles TaxID=591936 RepID=A0A8C9GRN9_9PRIM